MKRAYGHAARAFGALIFMLGVAMILATLAAGGGVGALGLILGVLFAGLGAGRFVLAGGRAPRRRA